MIRTLLVLLAMTTFASAQYSLTTQFAENNAQAGNMFDVVSLDGGKVVGFDLNLDGGTWTVEVYTVTDGGPIGPVLNQPAKWTLVATATVTSNGVNVPTPFTTPFEVEDEYASFEDDALFVGEDDFDDV